MVLRILGLLILLFLINPTAQAYPNYISYGYPSCVSCHYNPFGNGPLTDYGRVVGATAISDRLFWKSKASEEKIADKSGFFFGKDPVDWLRPSLNYRGLYLQKKVGDEDAENEFINMDVSASLVIKMLPRDQLIVVGQIAYAPKPRSMKEADIEEYRSREHYVGYRVTRELGLYIGLMDKVFGIRVPDHTAYSRMVTRNTMNDQVHSALVHYVNKYIELGIQPFAGNMAQDEFLRQKGVTSQIEFGLGDVTRLGFSVLGSTSNYLSMMMFEAHARTGMGKGNSLLLEIGQVEKEVKSTSASTESMYGLAQTHILLRRGLFGILTLEALRPDKTLKSYNYRIGPGFQFFPFQRVEFRTDAYNSTLVAEDGSKVSAWDIASQIHLWF